MGEIATIVGGSTPSRNKDEFWGGDIAWLTPTDLPMPGCGIAGVDNTASKITGEGLASISAQLLPVGTVLFSSRATIGKLGISRIPLATNQGFANLIPKDVIDAKYLAYVLQYFTGDIAALAGSTTFKEVNKTALRRFQIPLPAKSEQRQIVEILDQADALRRRRAEADEKAARILPALFYKMFGDPATWAGLPNEALGDLVDMQGGGTPSKKRPDYWGNGFPWISAKDMKQDFLHDAQDYITQLAIEETSSRLIGPNAILVVVRGMILARYVPLAVNSVPMAINQDIKALSVKDKRISPLYLFAALKAAGQLLLARVGTAAHGTRKLDTDQLLSLPVRIPGDREHEVFLTWFDRLRDQALKREVVSPQIDSLFSILLHRAFSGDLTAKWREAHMKEVVAEMEVQAKALESADDDKVSEMNPRRRHHGKRRNS